MNNKVFEMFKEYIGCAVVIKTPYLAAIHDELYISDIVTARIVGDSFELRTVELSTIKNGKFDIAIRNVDIDDLEFYISDLDDDLLSFNDLVNYLESN